jgi:hypothetical protein
MIRQLESEETEFWKNEWYSGTNVGKEAVSLQQLIKRIMKIRFALAMILLAALTRLGLNLLPVPPHNFSPITAIGLFGAACLGRRWLALAIPFAALFLSDLFINNVIYASFFQGFAWITSVWIYAAFGLVMLTGWVLLREKATTGRVVTASLAASVVFFLVSNLSTFFETPLYPKTFAGLMTCYTAGLPFFGNTILGDLFFTIVLFGAWQWVVGMREKSLGSGVQE